MKFKKSALKSLTCYGFSVASYSTLPKLTPELLAKFFNDGFEVVRGPDAGFGD